MSALRIIACGPGSTLQDLGRFGLQRFGVSPAGAMDPVSLAAANVLVGNPSGTAGIESAMLGMTLEALGDVTLAVVGHPVAVNGAAVPDLASFTAREGDRIVLGPVRGGLYGYLAVGGGFGRPAEMGSLSMHRRSGIGGRGLVIGDVMPVAAGRRGETMALPGLPDAAQGPIRVMLGPQDDLFTREALDAFLSGAYVVTPRSDRMGVRLSGPALQHARGFNIVSDGIVTGHVQVPGDGQPIVLMRDRQTTGGYPKIATVISADLPRLAQAAPGTALSFAPVARNEAMAALAALRAAIDALPSRLVSAEASLSSERLLAVNLISGVADWAGDVRG